MNRHEVLSCGTSRESLGLVALAHFRVARPKEAGRVELRIIHE